MDGMTARSRRVHTTLTTTANWGTNYATATTLGGGTWASATSALPYIRRTIMKAASNIQLSTASSVQLQDLFVVMNPNTAQIVATSQEFIDFLKQSPAAQAIWMGQEQYVKYNLPENLFGVNVVVDDTVYNSALPGEDPSFGFSFPDGYACIVTKQDAIKPAAGGAFSTVELFTYQDFEVNVYNDTKNRRYDLQVIENIDDSSRSLIAPESGYLVNIAA
jgi:hypothetical protein